MRGQHCITAAIDETEHIVPGDLLAKTNAARAKNAALIIERDAWPERDVFWFLHFMFEKTRRTRAVLNAEFLQSTFARLIANRTIERVINEKEFHHSALAFLHQRRICAHPHSFSDILRARDLRARYPVDHRFAVRPQLGFTIGAHFRHSHLDQTHPAIARRAEFLVITITRDITAGALARLDHAGAFRKLVPDPVNLDVEHWNWRFVRHN